MMSLLKPQSIPNKLFIYLPIANKLLNSLITLQNLPHTSDFLATTLQISWDHTSNSLTTAFKFHVQASNSLTTFQIAEYTSNFLSDRHFFCSPNKFAILCGPVPMQSWHDPIAHWRSIWYINSGVDQCLRYHMGTYFFNEVCEKSSCVFDTPCVTI